MGNREKRSKSRGSTGNNRKSSEDFLTKNKPKEGVFETASGLQYKVIEEGDGTSPFEGCNVIIHQRCALLNGKIIADTYKDNKPDEVPLGELIEGYREGLMLMKKGGKSKFFIPSELAWGKKGTGNKIPPNALLIFDVRLVDFW
jgi:FKBP-type peptidyl-prolyl cis-trans isomerase FkpA